MLISFINEIRAILSDWFNLFWSYISNRRWTTSNKCLIYSWLRTFEVKTNKHLISLATKTKLTPLLAMLKGRLSIILLIHVSIFSQVTPQDYKKVTYFNSNLIDDSKNRKCQQLKGAYNLKKIKVSPVKKYLSLKKISHRKNSMISLQKLIKPFQIKNISSQNQETQKDWKIYPLEYTI